MENIEKQPKVKFTEEQKKRIEAGKKNHKTRKSPNIISDEESQKTLEKEKKKKYERPDDLPDYIFFDATKGKISGINNALFSEAFCEKYKTLIYVEDCFYIYEENKYCLKTEQIIGSYILNFLSDNILVKDFLKTRHIEELIKYLKLYRLNLDIKIELNKDKHLMFFKNLVYNAKTKEIFTHSPKYYNTICNKSNLNFNADLTIPLKFYEEVFPTSLYKNQKTLFEKLFMCCGNALTSDISMQKCVIFVGNGANAKSLCLLILAACTPDTSSYIDLDLLFGQSTFHLHLLQNKTVNIATDTNIKTLSNSQFKVAVSGEPITADVKFQNAITFKPFCKFFFSLNKFGSLKDLSDGLYRRIEVLEFKRKFSEQEQDKNLLTKLTQPEILEAFILLFVKYYEKYLEQGFLTESEDWNEGFKYFKNSTDILQNFLDCYYEQDINSYVEYKEFRKNYSSFCTEYEYKELPDNILGQDLKNKGFLKKRKRINGKLEYILEGLKKI